MAAKKKPCPVCGKPADDAMKPFCSARCREVDLGNWFLGKYAVAGESLPDEAANGEPDDES